MKNIEISILRTLWAQPDSKTIEFIALATDYLINDVAVALVDMAGRGLIAPEGAGYRPQLTVSQYFATEIRGVVNHLYGGDDHAFLSDYIDAASPEDRAAMRATIEKWDRQS